MSRTASLVVTPFVVAIVFGGCGGGDGVPITTIGEASDAALEAPSRDDFIEEADDICAEANVAIANLSAFATDDQGTVSQEHQVTRSELEQLESLDPPKDNFGSLDRFFSALGKMVALLDRQAIATERADDAALAAISGDLSSARSQLRAAAVSYGFKHCGSTDAEATGSDVGQVPSATATPADSTPVTPAAPATPPPAAPTEPPATAPPAPPTGGSGGEQAPDDGGSTGGSGGISPGGGVSP